MKRTEILPHDEEGKPDWLGLIRTTWPLLVALVLITLWLGQRLESPGVKTKRIKQIVEPLVHDIEALHEEMDDHEATGGHEAMLLKMGEVQGKLDALYMLVLSNGHPKETKP